MKNKRGQLGSVLAFIGVLLMMIIMAPIILKIASTVLGTTATQLSTVDSTNNSATQVTFVKNKITGSFDWLIMFLVLFNILLLLISSFLIDIHPAFVIIYILGAFFLVVTIPYTASAGERIYSMSQFNPDVTQYLPMTEFLLNNFGAVIVGVLVLSGVIMYAKIRLSSNTQTGGGGY